MESAPEPTVPPSNTKMIVGAARSRLLRVAHELNLFDDHPFWSPILTYAEQILITRLFLLFVSVSLTIIVVYTSLSVRTHEVTLDQFALSDYERLEALYPTTIKAPCTQPSVPHDKFVQLSARFHHVCSSPFVRQKWIDSLFMPNATSHNILDFRTFAYAQFSALALLCRTAQQAVSDAQQTFASTQLVTSHVLPRRQFSTIVDVVVTNFQRNVIANERRTAALISLGIAENRVLSALRTNYYIQSVPGSRAYRTFNGEYWRENDTSKLPCFCRMQQNRCVQPAGVFEKWTPLEPIDLERSRSTPLVQIPGLMAGCLPFDSLRQSTLECLYDQSCVNVLTLQPQLSRPSALDASASASTSTFLINETVESMFDRSLFLETWKHTSHYDKYFAACAPQSLYYSYEGRFHMATICTICVGAFGGLVIAWQLATPLLVKIWKRWIWRRQRTHQTTSPHPSAIEEVILSRAPRPIDQVIVAHTRQTIYNFNLFPSDDDDDDPEEERVGIIATRLYILFLSMGLLLLAAYTILTTHTQMPTVFSPTLAEYIDLHRQYSTTLQCPCARMSIPYDRIMSITPRYHQVCSSGFVQDYWLSYFDTVQLIAIQGVFLTPDFRISGQSFFELLRILCETANEMVTSALDDFRSTRLFTVNALSQEQFKMRLYSRMNQSKQDFVAQFVDHSMMMRSAIKNNRLVTEMLTSASPNSTFDNRTSTWSLGFRARQFYTNNCSCALSDECTRPIGFYWQTDTVRSQPNVTVPGLVISCYPIDSFLLSTLECLYDQQCLQLLINKYDFGVVGYVRPLNESVAKIPPLQPSNSRFHANSTLKEIVSQLLVEDWNESIDYTAYYTRCAPVHCTYAVERRFDLPYMIAMMLGFCGGLSVILEVILPPLVRIARKLWRWKRTKPAENTTVEPDRQVSADLNPDEQPRPRSSTFRKLKSLNLFYTYTSSADQQFEHQGIVATRIYLLLFAVAMIAAILFAGPFSEEIEKSFTSQPTTNDVHELHNRSISTLSCPCSTAAISYGTFLNITPRFHRLCSSNYTSPSYWSYLLNKSDHVSAEMSSQYRILASLCDVSERIIAHSTERFGARELISVETLTRAAFKAKTDALVSNFLTSVPADFRRTSSFIIGAFDANQLINVFTSNWKVRLTNEEDYHLIGTDPRRFPSSNCTCATSADCREKIAEDLFSGCFPYHSFRLSKIERISMASLIKKLFVVAWDKESDYDKYFAACRPTECRWTVADPYNPIYMLVTVLGFYGGLQYALRLIVGQSLLAYRWWTKHIHRQ